MGLLTLMFRGSPFLSVEGGQDQGVYVSMSAHFARTHGLEITDSVREKLSEADKPDYDRLNTFELSGRKLAPAFLAAGLLAINPMHVFLSRFPVTENVTVFFSAGLRYVYLETTDQGGGVQSLILAATLIIMGYQSWLMSLFLTTQRCSRILIERLIRRARALDRRSLGYAAG